MKTPNGAREFWLGRQERPDRDEDDWFAQHEPLNLGDWGSAEVVHVIDFASYEKLQRQNKIMRDALEVAADICSQLVNVFEEQKVSLPDVQQYTDEIYELADRQALKEVGANG